MIVKKKDGYYVKSDEGKELGGPYDTHEAAVKRLIEVEYFKHMDRNKKKLAPDDDED
jgi:hypothetical protein